MRLTHVFLAAVLLQPAATVAQVTPPARRPPVAPPGAPSVPPPGHVWPTPQLAPPAGLPPGLDHDMKYGLAYNHEPPRGQQWYQDDPADSLYRAAYAYLNRQEYRQAADRFSNLRTRHPNSRYFCDAAYYEALSRHRLGTQADLRTGYRVLEGLGARCTTGARSREDMPELAARINNALARVGDAEAAERLKRAASEGQNVCDREERSIKIDALNALAQMDPQTANPVLRSVLNTKDVCSAPVRRQAIDLVARRNDTASVALLVQIARNEADPQNQLEAVRALGRMSSDAAYGGLEALIRSSNDERIQMEAAGAMARNDNTRVQAAVRALIERKDVSERIRLSAINSLAGRNLTTEYWQTLYGRVESEELRKAILNALSRNNSDEVQQFLLGLARNPAEPSTIRAAALSRVRSTAPIADLYKIFEAADSRSMRITIVAGLSQRKEPEATDRLIDILKNSTDPEVRGTALRALSQSPRKDDPKVIKALTDLVVCCSR